MVLASGNPRAHVSAGPATPDTVIFQIRNPYVDYVLASALAAPQTFPTRIRTGVCQRSKRTKNLARLNRYPWMRYHVAPASAACGGKIPDQSAQPPAWGSATTHNRAVARALGVGNDCAYANQITRCHSLPIGIVLLSALVAAGRSVDKCMA